ncbi:MAG TPA: formylglycine-generating enzyme family protein [Burkholderiales bacterium]|nr:formylglycine-generating enzyme family protein [Burkholderiales bacterium]
MHEILAFDTRVRNDVIRPRAPSPDDMVWIPGGAYWMGSDRHYRDEAPSHQVTVDGFWIDRYPVTNERFSEFVRATGHVTQAELPPRPERYTEERSPRLHSGSLVFVNPGREVDQSNLHDWWVYVRGAQWRHPQGPHSTVDDLERHPVVHITYADAKAFAAWEGKELPSEAEWEYAARGGLDRATYAWGDSLMPGGRIMANMWQKKFPWKNVNGGPVGTTPVGMFPENGYGLHDMIGNVWEWTSDWYRPHHRTNDNKVSSKNSPGLQRSFSFDPHEPNIPIPRKVLKGGSHLCAPNSYHRYRPAARLPHPIDTSTCHIGFRCIVRAPASTTQDLPY